MLEPIESYLRSDDPSDWVLVIRGRPLTVDSLLSAVGRTMAEFTWRGHPVAAISAEVTGPKRSTDVVLAGARMRTRRTYATAPVAEVLDRGFLVLPTFVAPHVSIVLPEYNEVHVRALLQIFGPERPNPHYMRIVR